MRFSVVIPVYQSQSTIERCIGGLRKQSFEDFEVIFVDSSPDDRSARIIDKYPGMKLDRVLRRLWMHAARNRGAKQARGEVLVFTDPDCVAESGWLATLEESFRHGNQVVGGSVGCYPGGHLEMAAHLIKYSMWLPTAESGYVDDIPSANLAIERSLFETLGGFSERYFSGDTLLSYRLRERGIRLFLNSRAVVHHIHEATLSSLIKERFIRGKDFFAMRTGLKEWNTLKSFLLLAALWFFLLRQFFSRMNVCRKRRYLKEFLLASPVILSCDVAWMVGQGVSSWRHLLGVPIVVLSEESR